jgi:DNA-binding beta-propeller fold protein YncE
MSQAHPNRTYRSFRRLFAAAALISLAVLLLATSARADYGQVANFAQSGEGEQLENATGAVAVNISGVGLKVGEAGSVYFSAADRILRYSATGAFREAWGWGVGDGKGEYERCGPALGTICTSLAQSGYGGEEAGHFASPQGLAVDQVTGYVYVLNAIQPGHREHNLIEVFSADGSGPIASFGDAGAENESVEEGPDKFHHETLPGGLAVDSVGTVYASDRKYTPGETYRVMVFEPQSSGDYEHYVYAGRGDDIAFTQAAVGPQYVPIHLALDDANDLYVANERSLFEFAPGEPDTAVCSYFVVPSGGLASMTANPQTGEVFYFSNKDKRVHRLGPCDPETGEFAEIQEAIKPTPPTGGLEGSMKALAVNPSLKWSAQRPAGVLYGADTRNRQSEENPGGSHGSGDVFAPAEVHPPSVESQSVANTGTASSRLQAEIDPHGFATHYVFQYLSEAEYEENEAGERFAGAIEAPLGGGEIGGGAVSQVSATVTGLSPDTAYRFRVLASSDCNAESAEPCVTPAEAAAFSTYPATAPGLPDHRVYELVSPAQKHGGEVIPAEPGTASCGAECKPGTNATFFPMQSSPSGEALVYEGFPFSPTEGAVNFDQYLSRRTGTGWQTSALSPALQGGSSLGHQAFDAGLDNGVLLQEGPELSPDAPAGYPNLYVQATGEPAALSPLLTTAPPNRSAQAFKLSYAGHSADSSRQFFAANDALTEATAFAPEAPDPGEAKTDLYEWSAGQLALVNVLPGNAEAASGASFGSVSPDSHTVSDDGRRVFFSDEAGQVYVRESGQLTTELSDHNGKFLTASPDGSEVLLSDGCLYDLATESCEDLSQGEGGFEGIAGRSEDLSHIYFVDSKVLAANQGAGLDEAGNPQHAVAGEDNLYSWNEGELDFVATLLPSDNTSAAGKDWAANPAARTAEASPHGRYIAFVSQARLTGYDNVGAACTINSVGEYKSAPCFEVFLYDSASSQLLCASCNPTGEAPLGWSNLRRIEFNREWLPQPRYLTDEGRLYFDSADRLSSRDTNGRTEDVYQFEPPGAGETGTCERQAGCVSLISAGHERVDSNFLAIDEDAKNVFFTSRDQLTLKDKDELIDVYDAREGGGIGAETEVARTECQGEACQPQAVVPSDPTPGSSTFEGAGNLHEEAKAKKPKHAKKHKKKRHAKKHRNAPKRTAKRNHGGAK